MTDKHTTDARCMPGQGLAIGKLKIPGRTFLAPLAGITNLPFRRLVKECGCAVVCSEMVSAKGIFYNSDKTRVLMASRPDESPLSIQLFGADPESMARAARVVQDETLAALVDVNFGCSVKKVVRQGAGVALMKEPALARSILEGMRAATTLPLTIKIRTGWNGSGDQALEIARIAEGSGVDAIALHPRTASQLFRGHSDWSIIQRLKEAVSIPVIGNGDIQTPDDAKRMMAETGCDAVMVGRAALADPFLLRNIDHFFETGTWKETRPGQIFRAMLRLTDLYVGYFGEAVACRMLRGRLAWFVKGFANSSRFRKDLSGIRSQAHVKGLIRQFAGPYLDDEPMA